MFQGFNKDEGWGLPQSALGADQKWWGYYLWPFCINFSNEISFEYPVVWTDRYLFHNRRYILF